MKWMSPAFLFLALCFPAVGADEFELAASSFLGSSNYNDAVVGVQWLSDGTVAMAANLGPDFYAKIGKTETGRPPPAGRGAVLLLGNAGKELLSLTWLDATLSDMAMDEEENVYLASSYGIVKMAARTGEIQWRKPLGACSRVDAAADGHCAALVAGKIHVFDPNGSALVTAKGHHYTSDVCIDDKSKTVIFCGFRNAKAFDGRKTYPVQICYVHGLAYDGKQKWTNYDWSTDRGSDRFLNKPENNMADCRADRCAIGRDGKLYVTFQVAGGNHLLRYSPKDITKIAALAGGDKYHQFYNSRSEHKCFFARYAPATGALLAGQQFCGRLSGGRANSVVTKSGAITADEQGRVYVVGTSAYGLPLSINPDDGNYTGGGFILVMSPDLRTRLLCTRTASGKGASHTVAARVFDKDVRAVYGGSGMAAGMFTTNALQARPADQGGGKDGPSDGFFVVIKTK